MLTTRLDVSPLNLSSGLEGFKLVTGCGSVKVTRGRRKRLLTNTNDPVMRRLEFDRIFLVTRGVGAI